MKLVKVKEKIKNEELILIGLGDIHLGSNDCDIPKLKREIEWIKKKDNARVILMGDLIDVGLKDSVGAGTYDNYITPEEQIDQILEFLYPIRNKIWCSISGNHENRIKERTSIDVSKLIAKSLQIPYDEHGCFVKANINGLNYIIYATHGSSGATTPATKIQSVVRLGGFIDADLYLHGHVHELMSHSTEYFKVDIKDKIIKTCKKYYVLTGHFLKYGGYAEQKCMSPGKTGVAKILLNTSKKDIHVSI